MIYPKHVCMMWNDNNLLNLKVVSWYVKFPWAQRLHMIFVWATQEAIGKALEKTKKVKKVLIMTLAMVYPNYSSIIWNVNNFVNPRVVSW